MQLQFNRGTANFLILEVGIVGKSINDPQEVEFSDFETTTVHPQLFQVNLETRMCTTYETKFRNILQFFQDNKISNLTITNDFFFNLNKELYESH